MPPTNVTPLSGRYLSFAEREEIALLRAQQVSVREIGRRTERASSTISRALRRNAATRSGGFAYRASTAQWHAERNSKRPKVAKLAANETLREYVQERLAGTITVRKGGTVGPAVHWNGRRHGRRHDRRWATSWSPDQISERLKLDFPDDESMRVSHEAICQALYVQGPGALRRELVTCLRTGRALRVPRTRTHRGKAFVSAEVMITERPPEANDRAVPGHWEGDLIHRVACDDRGERLLGPAVGAGRTLRQHEIPQLRGAVPDPHFDVIWHFQPELAQHLRLSSVFANLSNVMPSMQRRTASPADARSSM